MAAKASFADAKPEQGDPQATIFQEKLSVEHSAFDGERPTPGPLNLRLSSSKPGRIVEYCHLAHNLRSVCGPEQFLQSTAEDYLMAVVGGGKLRDGLSAMVGREGKRPLTKELGAGILSEGYVTISRDGFPLSCRNASFWLPQRRRRSIDGRKGTGRIVLSDEAIRRRSV